MGEQEQELGKIKKSLRELDQETLTEITSQYVGKRGIISAQCSYEDQPCYPFVDICGPFAEAFIDLDAGYSKTEDPEPPACGQWIPPTWPLRKISICDLMQYTRPSECSHRLKKGF